MYKNFSSILRILYIMDVTKLTRVLDILGIDCVVALIAACCLINTGYCPHFISVDSGG